MGSFSCHLCNSYFVLHILLIICCFFLSFTAAIDTIRVDESIGDADSLVSNGGRFKLGFFTPPNGSYRYVGVMYNLPVLTVFWVANRNNPVNDSMVTLQISSDGNLVILDRQKAVVWSTNLSTPMAINSSAVLLDTGNLVLRDRSNVTYIWESFRHASDSFMETMKLFTDLDGNEKNILSSWRSPSDPSPGSFTTTIEPLEIPQVMVRKEGTPYWRSGPWNGQKFIGIPFMDSYYKHGLGLVRDSPGSAYLNFTYFNSSLLIYYVVEASGDLVEKIWLEEEKEWMVTWSSIETECDICQQYKSNEIQESCKIKQSQSDPGNMHQSHRSQKI